MFGFLKNKLKEWLKKTKESEKQEGEKSKTFQSEAIQDETVQKSEPSFFQKIFKGLTTFKLTEPAFEEFFSELETILIENNVAIEAIDNLKAKLKEELLNKEIKKKEIEQKIKEALKRSMLALLLDPFDLEAKIKESKILTFTGT
ncbi:MAG: signal recognition particle receptor subunit alpha [Candidatus Pacearchaeota archaeon]